MYPVRGSAEPIEPTKYERHVARAADVLLERRFEDGAFGDVARRAIARQAISKSGRQLRPHACASGLRYGIHRTSLLLSFTHTIACGRHTGRSLRSGCAAASGSAPSGVEPSRDSSGKYPFHTAVDSASGDSEASGWSNATCGSGSVGVAAASGAVGGGQGAAPLATHSPSRHSLGASGSSSRACSSGRSGGGRPPRALESRVEEVADLARAVGQAGRRRAGCRRPGGAGSPRRA